MAALPQAAHDRYIETEEGLWDGDLLCSDKVTDEMLAMAYMRFKFEGLLPQIFSEGAPSLLWFIEHFGNTTGTEVLALMRQTKNGREMIGLSWLNSRTEVSNVFAKMETGAAFFKDYHDLKTTIQAIRLSIEFAFRYLGIEAMFGTTAEKNRGALVMARRAGFKMVGPLPHYTVWEGEPCGVWLSWMTKELWQEIRG